MGLLFLIIIISGVLYSIYHKFVKVYYFSGKAFLNEIFMILVISSFLSVILVALVGSGVEFILSSTGSIISFIFKTIGAIIVFAFSSIWILLKIIFISMILLFVVMFIKSAHELKTKKKTEVQQNHTES